MVSVFMLTILMLTVITPSAVMLTYFVLSITMLTCSAQRKCLYADHIYADCDNLRVGLCLLVMLSAFMPSAFTLSII